MSLVRPNAARLPGHDVRDQVAGRQLAHGLEVEVGRIVDVEAERLIGAVADGVGGVLAARGLQRGEGAVRVVEQRGELARAREGLLGLPGHVAVGDHQHAAAGDLDLELALLGLRDVGAGDEQGERRIEDALTGPVFVIDYPASICPLKIPDSSAVASARAKRTSASISTASSRSTMAGKAST